MLQYGSVSVIPILYEDAPNSKLYKERTAKGAKDTKKEGSQENLAQPHKEIVSKTINYVGSVEQSEIQETTENLGLRKENQPTILFVKVNRLIA
ncbi:MAG: hypothetical protein RMY33_018650 [Nostoc sp. DedQUE03]|nr:hypothetical protein [Nostoc sp. DedQUE02]